MMRAVKAVSTYRGRDPRDFSLLAFGGNGPLMALEIARELQISRLLVPPSPGVFSALGLLVSEAEYESIRTLFGLITDFQPNAIDKAFKELEREVLVELASDGLNAAHMQLSRLADFRYAGQAFELTIPLVSNIVNAGVIKNTVDAFHREHERTYQHMSPEAPVELVNIRVVSRSIASDHENVDPRKFLLANTLPTKAVADRLAYYGPRYDSVLTPVISRGELDLRPRHGPLIIEEYDATCVVPPGSTVLLDDGGNIEIHVGDYQ
jgi:N-methylhydantoinase A